MCDISFADLLAQWIFPDEDFFHGLAKRASELESQRQRRVVLPVLDGNDRLPRNSYDIR
jgi:hypothetical protein